MDDDEEEEDPPSRLVARRSDNKAGEDGDGILRLLRRWSGCKDDMVVDCRGGSIQRRREPRRGT